MLQVTSWAHSRHSAVRSLHSVTSKCSSCGKTSLTRSCLMHCCSTSFLHSRCWQHLVPANFKAVFCDHNTCSLQGRQCPDATSCSADAALIPLA